MAIVKARYGNTCDPEGDEGQHSLRSCDGWHRCLVVPVTALYAVIAREETARTMPGPNCAARE